MMIYERNSTVTVIVNSITTWERKHFPGQKANVSRSRRRTFPRVTDDDGNSRETRQTVADITKGDNILTGNLMQFDSKWTPSFSS